MHSLARQDDEVPQFVRCGGVDNVVEVERRPAHPILWHMHPGRGCPRRRPRLWRPRLWRVAKRNISQHRIRDAWHSPNDEWPLAAAIGRASTLARHPNVSAKCQPRKVAFCLLRLWLLICAGGC